MAPRAFDLDALGTTIPAIFDQVQSSAATHKKNCIALYKLQTASAGVLETISKGKKAEEIRLIGEKTFTDIFVDMVNRVLVVKKGVPTADRIVKFVGSYVKFIGEKSASLTLCYQDVSNSTIRSPYRSRRRGRYIHIALRQPSPSLPPKRLQRKEQVCSLPRDELRR